MPIITLFGILKTGPNCLRLPKPIFLGGKTLEEGSFFDEKIKGAGQNLTHNGVLVAPPSILKDPLATKRLKGFFLTFLPCILAEMGDPWVSTLYPC